MTAPLVLHNFFRSSASHRVRIALHLKSLPFEYVAIDITDEASAELARFRAVNPQGLVPMLVHGDVRLTQSLAILEYLEEIAPSPALLPADAAGRARVRSLAMYIVSEIQPLQNLRVFHHLQTQLGKSQEEAMAWRRYWIGRGFDALEKELSSPASGTFCHSDSPTIADCCLAPQVHAARRFGLDVANWPAIVRISAHAEGLEAFRKAAPENQPDAPSP